MDKEELRQRTKAFGLRVMTLVDALPNRRSANAIANQLVRSGTAIGANYRAACRARSRAEFSAKIGIVVEESDESAYWLELLGEGKLVKAERVQPLLNEANELLAIFSSSHAALRRNPIAPTRKLSPCPQRPAGATTTSRNPAATSGARPGFPIQKSQNQ